MGANCADCTAEQPEYVAIPPKQGCEQQGIVVPGVVQNDDHAFAA